MKTKPQNSQSASLEALLQKDSEAFSQSADSDLQKQIMAAVEREAALENQSKSTVSTVRKTFTWLFSGLSLVAVASYLSISLMPQLTMQDDANRPQIPQFSINSKLHQVGENIEKVEVASISKMTSEKEAIEKDIQNIIKAFSVKANRV